MALLAAPRVDPFVDQALTHLAELRRAARRLARGTAADDLLQETYLRALAAHSRGGFRAGSNARAWLHRILVNAAHTEHRRRARDERLAARLAIEPERTLAATMSEPRGQHVDAALSSLPAAQRRVVELADLDGLTYREAAARLGVPVGTVMSRLHRGRAGMRRYLGQIGAAQERQ